MVQYPNNTGFIIKEKFDELLEENAVSNKSNFLLEICNWFNFNLAIECNTYSRYFF